MCGESLVCVELSGVLSSGQLEDPVCDAPALSAAFLFKTAEFSDVPDSSAAEKISRQTDSFPSLSSFKLYLGSWREN